MKSQAIQQGHDSHYGLTIIEVRMMEIVMSVFALLVAVSCLFFLLKSELGDYRKRRAEVEINDDSSHDSPRG